MNCVETSLVAVVRAWVVESEDRDFDLGISDAENRAYVEALVARGDTLLTVEAASLAELAAQVLLDTRNGEGPLSPLFVARLRELSGIAAPAASRGAA